jgi:hypothetical protein
MYQYYKNTFFTKLLDIPDVSNEDKQKIKELLKKPWNPYIRRHSALRQKSTLLKEHVLRQHAGWSGRSQMHLKYLHYFGNESSESLLEAYGIVPKDQQSVDVLRPKQCPNCNEPNKSDSKFCAKCKMVLTYDAYNETLSGSSKKRIRYGKEVPTDTDKNRYPKSKLGQFSQDLFKQANHLPMMINSFFITFKALAYWYGMIYLFYLFHDLFSRWFQYTKGRQ